MYTCILVFFTVFLKNRNFSSKIKRSKVTDYAALNVYKQTNEKKHTSTVVPRPLSNDPRFTQCIYRYSRASKRFVEV